MGLSGAWASCLDSGYCGTEPLEATNAGARLHSHSGKVAVLSRTGLGTSGGKGALSQVMMSPTCPINPSTALSAEWVSRENADGLEPKLAFGQGHLQESPASPLSRIILCAIDRFPPKSVLAKNLLT